MQSDLDSLVEWAEKWQMKFSADKCKVMHIGSYNIDANYLMNGHQLSNVDEEKDLGIVISSNLKPSKHCSEIVKTAGSSEYESEKVFRHFLLP